MCHANLQPLKDVLLHLEWLWLQTATTFIPASRERFKISLQKQNQNKNNNKKPQSGDCDENAEQLHPDLFSPGVFGEEKKKPTLFFPSQM